MSKILAYRILFKPEGSTTWKEFIKYETKEEAISYLENVNPTLRPAIISFGECTLRAYDNGILDYEMINRIEGTHSRLIEYIDKRIRELQSAYEQAEHYPLGIDNVVQEIRQSKIDELRKIWELLAI